MKTITLNCIHCQHKFERKLSEHNKNVKNGMFKTFCSLSCFAYNRNASMTDDYWKEQYEKQKKSFDIKSQCGNRQDEYSPFKTFLNSGRASIKKHKSTMNIDLQYLKEQWEKQNGICPYTGIKMILPKNSAQYSIHSLKKASLDRIDCSLGYIKGNVEFVCMGINLAKVNHSKKETEEFIKEIKNSSV